MVIGLITDQAIKLFVCGLVVHLVLDWLLQNHWMAQNKSNLSHPAAYVHGMIHFVGLLLIFPPNAALIIAISHVLIDTRIPLAWWRKFYKQTTEGPVALHVALWSDQVCHITVLAIAAFIVGGRS